jgi:predicted flap endonuclease-1-like 5' DNA nuclease
MASNKYIVGLFDHEDKLINAIRSFKKEKVEITDALTPFPVHGLEDELGLRETRLHTTGFLFGITGTFVALSVLTWIMTTSYPINYGGKPNFALPSFIPITFELTVLFASVGMVIVYCIRNGLYPGAVPRILDERITDDRFALKFEVDDHTTKADVEKIVSLLKGAGACDISAKEFDDDTEIFEVETSEVDSLLFGMGEAAVAAKVATKPAAPIASSAKTEKKVLSSEEFEAKKAVLMSAVGSVADGRKDDLRKVKGIGPVFEGKLNELGIFTFEQIAKLKDEAREAIEDLTGFPGRVEREDWIGQVKVLMNK